MGSRFISTGWTQSNTNDKLLVDTEMERQSLDLELFWLRYIFLIKIGWNFTIIISTMKIGGIHVVRIPYQRVWRPDIILYNNADAQYTSSVINTNVIVSDNGEVNNIA